jgi:hypothetical protein
MPRTIPSRNLQSRTSRTVSQVSAFWRVWTPIAVVSIGLSACAVSSVQPLTVPLVYKAGSKQPVLAGSYACSTIAQVRATDARTDKSLGMRVHESKPLKAELSASGDANSWVADGVQRFLTQTGIHVQGSGPTLDVTLDSLRSSESIWHRSSYESRVALSARLHSPAGKICWQDDFQGTSGDYGYSGSIETFQGTLNGALDAATLRLAESQGFRNALCHCGE